MFYDIIFPKNNEKDFIPVAEKLGIQGILFAYDYDKNTAEKIKSSVQELQKTTKIKLQAVFRVSGAKIYKAHDSKEIVITEAAEGARDIIAKYKPNIVYNLELGVRKDFAKTRNSGLDKGTCQFARDNDVVVAFSFSAMLNAKNLPLLLGRVRQNIKLTKKYKVKTAIASLTSEPYEMRSPHDLKSLLLALGMYTANAKESVEAISAIMAKSS
ncbi:hypothetical protein HYX10_05055 [Candidatus Woesearchaeota archaeon]|nr:hypothetical protein [Candidatus Woesearchaeota archaeon]